MLPLPASTNELLQQAQALGFVVQSNSQGAWQICSPSAALWLLEHKSTQEQWILVVRNMPQIRFAPAEASRFPARLRQSSTSVKR
jgi:hypothetical protein